MANDLQDYLERETACGARFGWTLSSRSGRYEVTAHTAEVYDSASDAVGVCEATVARATWLGYRLVGPASLAATRDDENEGWRERLVVNLVAAAVDTRDATEPDGASG